MYFRNRLCESSSVAAVDSEPDNFEYLYALAEHYARREEFELALAVAEQIIASHPGAQIGRDMKASLEQAIAEGGG